MYVTFRSGEIIVTFSSQDSYVTLLGDADILTATASWGVH